MSTDDVGSLIGEAWGIRTADDTVDSTTAEMLSVSPTVEMGLALSIVFIGLTRRLEISGDGAGCITAADDAVFPVRDGVMLVNTRFSTEEETKMVASSLASGVVVVVLVGNIS